MKNLKSSGTMILETGIKIRVLPFILEKVYAPLASSHLVVKEEILHEEETNLDMEFSLSQTRGKLHGIKNTTIKDTYQ